MKRKMSVSILTVLIFGIFLFYVGRIQADEKVQVEQKESTKEYTKITDMAGREVEIPIQIDKVYSTGQPGVVMLYTLCPDKLLGWCIKPADKESVYLNPKYLTLPVLGLMQGSNESANKEEIIKREPDIILCMTDLRPENLETAKADAEELQALMHIPVVLADYGLTMLPVTYDFLGGVLREEARAKELGEYCSSVLKETKEVASNIPEKEKCSIYYAQGSTGLQTAPRGSSHSEVIDMVGGMNVVELEAESNGRINVNMEQVLLWNPQVILASYSMEHSTQESDESAIFSILTNANEAWSLVEGVKNHKVYETPCLPYNWLDMPPSVNRIIGILWLGNLLYPSYYEYEIKDEIKMFYQTFYDVELKEESLSALLENAVR